MFSRLESTIARLRRNTKGNVAMIFAIGAVPVFALAGGSIDATRMLNASAQLQKAAEAGALAAASYKNENKAKNVASDYVKNNLPSGGQWSSLKITTSLNNANKLARKAIVDAEVTVPMSFLKLIGISSQVVTAHAEAEREAINSEISLVFDISSSMEGSKFDALKDGLEKFVNLTLDGDLRNYNTINWIPFAGTVNIGRKVFERYAFPDEAKYYKTNEEYYSDRPGYRDERIPYKEFRFHEYGECIEYRHEDFDLGDMNWNRRPQVPRFVAGGSDRPWCPGMGAAAGYWPSRMFLNRNNKAVLLQALKDIELGHGTGMDIGMLWGGKALSPFLKDTAELGGGKVAGRPAGWGDKKTRKFVVLLTDGKITDQPRPREPYSSSAGNLAAGPDFVKLGGANKRFYITKEEKDFNMNVNQETQYDPVAYFKKMCNLLKAKNVQIYTIGFKINKNTLEDSMLSYCASSPSHYYFVEDLDLESAFEAISNSMTNLKLSG